MNSLFPKRIQRKRSAGWKMPEGAVYVGRPSEWGNPYTGDGPINHELMASYYREYLHRPEQAALRQRAREQLRGKDLACWCPPGRACHADALLEIANSDEIA